MSKSIGIQMIQHYKEIARRKFDEKRDEIRARARKRVTAKDSSVAEGYALVDLYLLHKTAADKTYDSLLKFLDRTYLNYDSEEGLKGLVVDRIVKDLIKADIVTLADRERKTLDAIDLAGCPEEIINLLKSI